MRGEQSRGGERCAGDDREGGRELFSDFTEQAAERRCQTGREGGECSSSSDGGGGSNERPN